MVWLGYHWWHPPLEMTTIVYEREIGDDDGYELKTSFQITTSRFRNYFVIIPICFVWKLLASCVGSKFLWTVLKQKKKRRKNLPSGAHVLEVDVLQRTGKKCTKCKPYVQSGCFCSFNTLFCVVLVAVAVLVFFLTKDSCGARWMFFFFFSS